jgi:MFS family permease
MGCGGVCSRFAVLTAAYSYTFLIIGLVQGMGGPSFVLLQGPVNATEAQMGSLVVARSVGWLAGSGVSGYLFGRFNGHMLLIAACIALTTTFLLVPFAAHVYTLAALFLATGIAGGVIETGGNTLLFQLWADAIQPWLQFLNFCIAWGAFLSPLIMELFLLKESAEFSLIASFWLLAFLFVPPIFLLSSNRPPDDGEKKEDDRKESSESAEKHEQNVSSPSPASPVVDSSNNVSVSSLTNWPLVLSIAFFTLVISGIEVSTGAYVSMFAGERFKWTPVRADLAVSCFYLGFSLSRLVMSFVPARVLSGSAVLSCLTIFMGVSVVCMAVAAANSAGAMLLGSLVGLGFGIGPMYAGAMSFPIQSHAKYLLSARDVSVIVSSSNVGELIFPAGISLLWTVWGPLSYVYAILILALLTVISWIFLFGAANGVAVFDWIKATLTRRKSAM